MKKLEQYFILFCLLVFLFLILNHSAIIMNCVTSSMILCFKNLIPSLLPMFLISDLLIQYGLVEIVGRFFEKPMAFLFGTGQYGAFVFLLSILSGCPGNAKYIDQLLKDQYITEDEANQLLVFTHFTNPLFILGTVALLLKDARVAFLILLIHYGTNLLLGIFLKPKKKVNIVSKNRERILPRSFGSSLTKAIQNSIQTILLVLGVIVTFSILSELAVTIVPISDFGKSILYGIFEITKGIKAVTLLEIPLKMKAIIITFFLSFGGISIHMQVKSILNDYSISYFSYLKARLLHAFLSTFFVFFIL